MNGVSEDGFAHRWLGRLRRGHARQVALGVLFCAIAAGLRFALAPVFGSSFPWILFLPAIVAASTFGGTTAAVTSLLCAVVFGELFFGHPTGAPNFGNLPLAVRVTVFAGVGSVLGALGVALHRALATSLEQQLQLRAQVQDLERLHEVGTGARIEAEQALDALREAERRKDEFLAMLAHELRNPLAPISNAMSLLETVAPPEPRLDRAREIVSRQIVHLSRLIDDLLDVSRITHGKIRLEHRPIALGELIQEAVETARPLIDEHRHTLWVTALDSRICVEGDRARLAQAIANLLLNSAKFTPDGGQIWLDAGEREGRAWLRVRDTGTGIPAELQSRVFDLFVQEEATLARSHGGLGVGLTLVKRLIELHGGSVELHSEGRGHGCEVTLELPTLPAQQTLDASSIPAALPGGFAPLRVLIVEDNLDAAETFEMLISLEGHRTRVAHDGAAALRSLDEFQPQLAFIDLGLPDMDGFELARRLRADARTEKTVLAAVTGYGREEDKLQAHAAGFDHHLTKPVQREQIRKLLAAGRSR